VADFSIDFQTKARQSDWNSSVLRDAFLHGLADCIEDEIILHTPTTLDWLIEHHGRGTCPTVGDWTCPSSSSGSASAIYGHLLGTVAHQTTLVQVLLSSNHPRGDPVPHSAVTSYSPDPGVRCHNPHMDWTTGAIRGWSPAYQQVYLQQAAALMNSPSPSALPDSSPQVPGLSRCFQQGKGYVTTSSWSLRLHNGSWGSPTSTAGSSVTTAPLPHLSQPSCPPSWPSTGRRLLRQLFQTLKARFTSASILQVPDPARQFIVEVKASDVGVGACPFPDGNCRPFLCLLLSATVPGREEL